MNTETLKIRTSAILDLTLLSPQIKLRSDEHLTHVAKNTIYSAQEQDNMDLIYTGNRRFFRSNVPDVIELGLNSNNELYQITNCDYKLTYSKEVENCLKYIINLQQKEAEELHAGLEEIKHIINT